MLISISMSEQQPEEDEEDEVGGVGSLSQRAKQMGDQLLQSQQ